MSSQCELRVFRREAQGRLTTAIDRREEARLELECAEAGVSNMLRLCARLDALQEEARR